VGKGIRGHGSKRGLLFKVGVGMSGLALALVTALAVWVIPVYRGFGRALRAEAQIDREYAPASAYTPDLDGKIARERTKVFLSIRRVLAPSGHGIAARREAFLRMESHRGEAEPRPSDVLRDAWRALGDFVHLPGELGNFVALRDGALLANRMGLGEYTWLYVVCYVGGLGERPTRVIPDASRPDLFVERVYPQVREMIRRRVESARGGGASPGDLDAWRLELAALEADPARVPFQDGLPEGLEASIAPYRVQLAALSCPAAAEPDLTHTLRRGLGYDHR
jgi:hypothetical protein